MQISLSLTPLVFTPGELAINGYLYIVHRGIALYGGRVLTSGKVWGEDCLIAASHLQRRWCARAMNYLEVCNLLATSPAHSAHPYSRLLSPSFTFSHLLSPSMRSGRST